MNILTVIEMLRFLSPIVMGIILNHLTVPKLLLVQWEKVFFYQNAFTFAYLWSISQIQLTLVPSDPSYRYSLSLSNIVITLPIIGVLVFSLSPIINDINSGTCLFLFSFFLLNGYPLEYHFYTHHQYIKALISVVATQTLGILTVAIIYFSFQNNQPFLKTIIVLTIIHAVRTLIWWYLSPPAWSSHHLIKLVRHWFPLWGSYLLSGMALYIDGWLVEHNLDADHFLFFRYGAREFPLSTIMASALSASIAFQLAKESISHQPTRDWIRNKILRFQRIIFPVSIVLLICSDHLFAHFYQKQYSGSALFFDGFLLLTVSRVIFSQSYMLALGLQKKMFFITVIELLIHISLSWLLIPYLGWRTIVISTICAYFYEKIAFIILLKNQGVNYWNVHPVQEFWIGSSLLGITYLLKYFVLS